jgi:hypothetical protein
MEAVNLVNIASALAEQIATFWLDQKRCSLVHRVSIG